MLPRQNQDPAQRRIAITSRQGEKFTDLLYGIQTRLVIDAEEGLAGVEALPAAIKVPVIVRGELRFLRELAGQHAACQGTRARIPTWMSLSLLEEQMLAPSPISPASPTSYTRSIPFPCKITSRFAARVYTT